MATTNQENVPLLESDKIESSAGVDNNAGILSNQNNISFNNNEKKEIPALSQAAVSSSSSATSTSSLIDQLHDEVSRLKQQNTQGRVILIGIDSSQASKHAVEWSAQHNLIKHDDIIILMCCWEDKIDLSSLNYIGSIHAAPVVLPPSMIDSKEIYRENKKHLDVAKHLLKQIYKSYFHDNQHVLSLLVATHYSDNDSIGKVIINASNKLECDLIIVGSRGLGKLEKFFMGSVSSYVVNHSKIPVLLIKS
jgi:nucleotide-binding universal stress UspA family protein